MKDHQLRLRCVLLLRCVVKTEVGRLGAHRRNLLHHLKVDLWKRLILLESYDDILHLRELASDRSYWRKLFNFTVEYKSI